jgi:hypothetical protein
MWVVTLVTTGYRCDAMSTLLITVVCRPGLWLWDSIHTVLNSPHSAQ